MSNSQTDGLRNRQNRNLISNNAIMCHICRLIASNVSAGPRECYPIKAKFHYTDPTRTGPDTDKVRAHCRRRAKFHYTDPTRTRPDPHGLFCGETPLGPCRVRVRVRVVEFSLYPTTCADFVRDRTVSGPCRVRVGFVSVSV